MSAPVRTWTAEPLSAPVQQSLARLSRRPGVVAVAAMPDVHLAREVCIGTVLGTEGVIYPDAIGGDIGCGISTLRFRGDIDAVMQGGAALMERLRRKVPILRHPRQDPLPESLLQPAPSPPVAKAGRREGALQLGTIGRGNHFLELQRDDAEGLWLTVHSGSRSMGPCVQRVHSITRRGREGIAVGTAASEAFLRDHDWAVAYARRNRERITLTAGALLMQMFGLEPDEHTHLDCTHNMVRAEVIGGQALQVHRKGAISARQGERGIIPGSMGEATFLVEGRGCEAALCSSSHGAGRVMSRTEARRRIRLPQLRRETLGVHIHEAVAGKLVEEAPSAYKDIHAVMRAQRALTRVVQVLQPVLNYKGV